MAKQFETTYKTRIKAHLERKYPGCWCLVAQMLVFVGIPDLILCIEGRFVALELKKSKKEALAARGRIVLQRHILGLIRKAGGFGEIMYPENQYEILVELDLWLNRSA